MFKVEKLFFFLLREKTKIRSTKVNQWKQRTQIMLVIKDNRVEIETFVFKLNGY